MNSLQASCRLCKYAWNLAGTLGTRVGIWNFSTRSLSHIPHAESPGSDHRRQFSVRRSDCGICDHKGYPSAVCHPPGLCWRLCCRNGYGHFEHQTEDFGASCRYLDNDRTLLSEPADHGWKIQYSPDQRDHSCNNGPGHHGYGVGHRRSFCTYSGIYKARSRLLPPYRDGPRTESLRRQ